MVKEDNMATEHNTTTWCFRCCNYFSFLITHDFCTCWTHSYNNFYEKRFQSAHLNQRVAYVQVYSVHADVLCSDFCTLFGETSRNLIKSQFKMNSFTIVFSLVSHFNFQTKNKMCTDHLAMPPPPIPLFSSLVWSCSIPMSYVPDHTTATNREGWRQTWASPRHVKPANCIFSNCFSCCTTEQCNTIDGKRYPSSSTYMSSRMPTIG